MPTKSNMSEREEIRAAHPDSWVAVSEGDFITGTLTYVTDAWSDVRKGGSYYPLLTVKVDEASPPYRAGQELTVHCFGEILYNEVMKERPEIGEQVTFTFLGVAPAERAKKGQNPPNLYRVRVPGRKDQAARAYDRIGGASSAPARGVPQVEPDLPTEPVEQPALAADPDGADHPFS